MAALPFEDSRRLTGANLFFPATGAVLEHVGASADAGLVAAWRGRVLKAAEHLQWPEPRTVSRFHAHGVSMALSAPLDQLYCATEVNEWALCASLAERDPSLIPGFEAALSAQAAEAAAENPSRPMITPVIEASAALSRLSRLSHAESNPRLMALVQAAQQRGLLHLEDDDILTLGGGVGASSFAMTRLPEPGEVDWPGIRNVPTVLVTGSNGKTTTVRLLAAFARAQGWHAGYNCTDGVFLDASPLATGDYSGPAGARLVLRDPRTEAAVLETARGGILRRGLAVPQADVAVVTNVSSDHFGEYGIDDLAGLAQVKLVVAAAVKSRGLLVLNAEDAVSRDAVRTLESRWGRCPPLGWFAADEGGAAWIDAAHAGEPLCAPREERLVARHAGREFDLGAVASMPLTVGGVARYNLANIAAASLAGLQLGIPAHVIAEVLSRFGSKPSDNDGRLMRFERDGVIVFIDYAHNPEGLHGLLSVANHVRRNGRLGLILGHAGNRLDEDIAALAACAVQFAPDMVVIKENQGHLRGRLPGEVPRILRTALLDAGLRADAIHECPGEVEAAQFALQWARPGDVLALPLHAISARRVVVALFAAP